jgi:hypothetical protein
MRNLPRAILQVLRPFELLVSARVWQWLGDRTPHRAVFEFELLVSARVWQWAKILLIGAILAPGKRTVTAALRVMGLSHERQFQNSHRVLTRAVWSPRARARVLRRLLLEACVPADAPVVLGRDDHSERRRGAKISATGIDRAPVRSSKAFFVTTSGLRWLCLMLLAPIPWAERVWALPLLTVLAPAERSHQQRGQRHTQRTEWARQLIRHVRAGLPERWLVVVADRSYAALERVAACQQWPPPVSVVPRLRLDAALYHPAPAPQPWQVGRPRKKGERQPIRAARLRDPTTIWPDPIVRWYGGSTRRVQRATTTAGWDHTVRHPRRGRWP